MTPTLPPTAARLLLLAAAAVLLAGCESVPPAPEPQGTPAQAWALRQKALSGYDNWRCAGRVGIIDGREGFSASLRWDQAGDSYEIRLSGPLGQGLVQVIGSPQGVALRTADEGTLVAPTAEALLQRKLGWHLPVTGLRYWIVGLTVPGTPIRSQELDAYGRLTRLEQSGWEIRFLGYTRVGELDLPSKLELEHPPLSARISLSSWQDGD